MPEATGEDEAGHGLCITLACSLCACAKALMKLNEAEVLRKMKATAIACFEEATFFSLKGEVKRWGGLEGCPGGWSWMLSPAAGAIPGIHKPPADSGSLLADSSRSGCFPFPLQVCWCMQRLQLAETMMREALSLLRRNFPETSPGAFVKAQVEKLPCVA